MPPAIAIHPYKSTWVSDFASIKAQLAGVLGRDALQIEHIGSTAVPGLSAKDVIDIQVAVASLSPEIASKLQAAGYEFVAKYDRDHIPEADCGPEHGWRKMYFRQRLGQRPCHIHVRMQGNPNHRYALLFRDYLRAHESARMTVELIKRELARLHADDVDAYYAVKDPVYDLVWHAANVWAAATGWRTADVADA